MHIVGHTILQYTLSCYSYYCILSNHTRLLLFVPRQTINYALENKNEKWSRHHVSYCDEVRDVQ